MVCIVLFICYCCCWYCFCLRFLFFFFRNLEKTQHLCSFCMIPKKFLTLCKSAISFFSKVFNRNTKLYLKCYQWLNNESHYCCSFDLKRYATRSHVLTDITWQQEICKTQYETLEKQVSILHYYNKIKTY